MSIACESVVLRGGVTAPHHVRSLLWRLEDRGLSVRCASDGYLKVSPKGQLSAGERACSQRYRSDVVRLVKYEAPKCA